MGDLVRLPGTRRSLPREDEATREPLLESWRSLLETLGRYIASAPEGSSRRVFLRAGFKLLEAEFVDQADVLGYACSIEQMGDGRVRVRYWTVGRL